MSILDEHYTDEVEEYAELVVAWKDIHRHVFIEILDKCKRTARAFNFSSYVHWKYTDDHMSSDFGSKGKLCCHVEVVTKITAVHATTTPRTIVLRIVPEDTLDDVLDQYLRVVAREVKGLECEEPLEYYSVKYSDEEPKKYECKVTTFSEYDVFMENCEELKTFGWL